MSAPDWADAEVLRVCTPDLYCRCDWPDCPEYATHEVEFDVGGAWQAHRVCPSHRAEIGVGVGEA